MQTITPHLWFDKMELKERFAECLLMHTLLSIGLAVLGGLLVIPLGYGIMSLK